MWVKLCWIMQFPWFCWQIRDINLTYLEFEIFTKIWWKLWVTCWLIFHQFSVQIKNFECVKFKSRNCEQRQGNLISTVLANNQKTKKFEQGNEKIKYYFLTKFSKFFFSQRIYQNEVPLQDASLLKFSQHHKRMILCHSEIFHFCHSSNELSNL